MWEELLLKIIQGDIKSVSRAISLIENETEGCDDFLKKLPANRYCPIIGITGPPGAGKSTLTDALIEDLLLTYKKISVLCIDPSSPYHFGSILGDRIRMNQWYNNPNVYIRSLSSRGSLGGLCPMVIEITELLKSAGFDLIIIETVGVGQSEVEIAGIADTTVVVLVPESGDDIQSMKAGLMEIADIFVVNKSDRPGADSFFLQLKKEVSKKNTEVIKMIATTKEGINLLVNKITKATLYNSAEIKLDLLEKKIYKIILSNLMKEISRDLIRREVINGEKNIFLLANKIKILLNKDSAKNT